MSPRQAMIPPIEGTPEQLDHALLDSNSPPLPVGWTTPASEIRDDYYARLDAEHYDPESKAALEPLAKFKLTPLRKWADVDLPSPFTRVWADDETHGLPYVNATDLISYTALGVPEKMRFLSLVSDTDIERLLLREGTLLVTCSGTLGRVYIVPPSMSGWAGTHDLVRVKPHDGALTGYLLAYLRSNYAQTQLLADGYGGQVDHLTDRHVGACLVPEMDRRLMLDISHEVNAAEHARYNAVKRIRNVIGHMERQG